MDLETPLGLLQINVYIERWRSAWIDYALASIVIV